ncbi:MAG: dihydrolipoyl dehydrogenase [Pirellulales bacterium]|nr:dihydrolipoyl dehydrogenase [Pirellulales bacterium]
MDTQLAVIGGGPGGYAAAFLAADLGLQATIVDLEERLGGVCLLRGCIPSKALLHVAKAMAEARHLGEWGIQFGDPKIDVGAVRSRKEKVIAALTGGLKQIAQKRNVRVVRARAVFESSDTLQLQPVDGKPIEDDRLRFDHCILATGSSSAAVPGLDLPSRRLMDSTAALDLPDVPESLLVIGGGYIGLEMGTVYAALGSRVTVVELTEGLLPGADRDLVKPLAKRLEKDFEAIYLNTKVVGMKEKGNSIEVTFDSNVETKKERYSRVLMSVGRRPNSASLGLENTKVEVSPQGFVVVDRQQRTADPKVFAIGDVAGQPMLAHKASHEGKVAVEVIAGENVEFAPRAIPAVVFTDPEVAWAGVTETDAKRDGRKIEVVQFPWGASGRAVSVGRTEGLTKWIIDPGSERVIGCGIVGAGAGDLIAEAVLAIEMGCAVRDITESIHAHPTLSETLGAAAEVFYGRATDLYRPKRERKAGSQPG